MPNWKYPCIECKGPVKTNQKGIECNACNIWVHLNCTDLTKSEYDFLEKNESLPFYCRICKERPLYSDTIFENTDISSDLGTTSVNNDSASSEFSSAHSSDFEYVTDSDQENETRGLNFYALPVQNAVPANVEKNSTRNIPVRVLNYKYPCLICHKPCKEKVHDSISCTLCDEWVHQTCSDLSIKQFRTYCSPDHEGDPYYCEYCRYGYSSLSQSLGKLSCPSATTLNSIDIDNLDTISPNSIFRGKDDIILSDYYNIEELNQDMQKTPNDILIIHINIVSLLKNYDFIVDLLASLQPTPSILFISETRIKDPPSDLQLNQIRINGYSKPLLNNTTTNAGGTAIYVSENLNYTERPDIKFNHPDCEACFIEVECDTPDRNPIFGALYRHPRKNVQSFTSHLGDFLENFTVRGNKLTILGDINIDLNRDNVVSNEYMKTLNSLGFSAFINQPTRICKLKDSDHVSCSTLDHLITNSGSSVSNAGILISDVSDHLPIFASIKLSKSNTNPLKNTFRRFFPDTKKDKFIKCLEENLKDIDFSLSPNRLMDNKYSALNETCYKQYIPTKKSI